MKNGTVVLWNFDLKITTFTQIASFQTTASTSVSAIAWDTSPGRNYLAVGSCDSKVWLWDVSNPNTPTLITKAAGSVSHSDCVDAVVFDPTAARNTIASSNPLQNPGFWLIPLNNTPATLSRFPTVKRVRDMIWSEGGIIILITDAGYLHILDSRTLKDFVGPIQYDQKVNFIDMDYKEVGNKIVVATSAGQIDIWSYPARSQLTPSREVLIAPGIRSLTVDPQGQFVMGADDTGKIKLWSLTTNENLGEAIVSGFRYNRVAWHPVSNVVIAGDDGGGLTLWVVEK